LNWSHTAAHLYRAVLEGVALEYRLYRDVQINRPEGAPLGAALLAGCGVGLFRSLDSAAGEWIQRIWVAWSRGKAHEICVYE